MKTLLLQQFRNYKEPQVEFTTPKTRLVSNNAQGKLNLLVAVELLTTSRSHRMARDRNLIRDGEETSVLVASSERLAGVSDLSL